MKPWTVTRARGFTVNGETVKLWNPDRGPRFAAVPMRFVATDCKRAEQEPVASNQGMTKP